MIVDSHVHIFEDGHGGPFDLPSTAEDIVKHLDDSHIDAAVILPLPGVASNEYVQRECARFPDRLFPLYTPDFSDARETLPKLESFFRNSHAHGLKIHPRVQNISVATPVVLDVLDWASENNKPVLFDAFPFGAQLADIYLHPISYLQVAQDRPKLRLILAHAGGYKLHEAFMVAKSAANIYLDISFTPVYFKGSSIAADIAFLCARLPPGRVLYGSDFPYVRIGEHLETVRELLIDLSSKAKALVFGDAAKQLFTLS